MSETGSDEPRRRLPQPPPTTPASPFDGPATAPPTTTGAHARAGDPSSARPGGVPYPAARPSGPAFPGAASFSAAAQPGRVPATPDVPTGSSEPDDGSAAHRRMLLLIGGIAAGVVVVGAIVLAVLMSQDDDVAVPGLAPTVVLPSPTPTIAPVERSGATAFAAALPVTVLQFALASSAPADDWVAAGAIEASVETYSDGGTGQVVVQAGQWETAEEATAFAQGLVAALPVVEPAAEATPGATTDPSAVPATPALPESGEVTVDGAAVGTYSIVDAGDGTGIAVWSNGTAVFRATAPVATIHDVYAAFPL